MRSVISKQNLNKVPWMFIDYKFVRAMFIRIQLREVGDVPPILLKHQLTPFLVILHFSNFQSSTWYKNFPWRKSKLVITQKIFTKKH